MANSRTGPDYLDRKPTPKKPKAKKKSGIDPKSTPGKVLKQRTKDSKSGKIPMGSRSYQGPDTRTPWERGGMSESEYKKLPKKYKDMLN